MTADTLRFAFLLPDLSGGGAERVTLTIIEDFLQRGHTVDLLLMRARGDLLPLVPRQVRIVEFGVERIRHLVWPLAKYIEHERPNALQISMWPLTVAGIVSRALSRTRSTLVVSDHSTLSRQYANRGRLHRQLLKWSVRLAYPLADVRVVVAREVARDLSRLSGLPADAFKVIYNPIAPPSIPVVGSDVDDLWGGGGYRILNVARLTAEKNQLLLIKSFASLAQSVEARLIILGEGPLRSELLREAEKLGVADRVLMPGFKIDPSPFYRSADVFVLSSEYEGYPTVLLEAMQAGLQVVSTDCASGPSEILANGQFGKLVPCGEDELLGQAIFETLMQPSAPERLRRRAYELSSSATDQYFGIMSAA
ncbi:glycosyltransferase involved in cell wall biosynthesis [Sphingomonas sp. F9_3S_D5_B_2]